MDRFIELSVDFVPYALAGACLFGALLGALLGSISLILDK